jgi:hypothetical protein
MTPTDIYINRISEGENLLYEFLDLFYPLPDGSSEFIGLVEDLKTPRILNEVEDLIQRTERYLEDTSISEALDLTEDEPYLETYVE